MQKLSDAVEQNEHERAADKDVKASLSVLKDWGLGGDEPLQKAALNVSRFRGAPTGRVVVGLGLASDDEVERLMAAKPSGVKTLEWLRDSGVRHINTRMDEILAIQDGMCYVNERFSSLTIHPSVVVNESAFFKRHQNELNQLGLIPMDCNGQLVLMFSNFEHAVQLRGMGKKDRLSSPLICDLARTLDVAPDKATFRVMLALPAIYHSYLNALVTGAAELDIEESSQVLRESEAGSSVILSKLINIITEAIRRNVNDVAISPDYTTHGAVVEYRYSQEMTPAGISLTREERIQVVNTLLARSRANTGANRATRPLDGNMSFESRAGDAFIRLSFIPLEESRMEAVSVSMRILPKTTKPIILSELGIEPDIEEELRYMMRLRDGLFVVAGPTGSGKSTTIGGMLCEHYALFGDKRKRLSVEQPVERILPGVKHIDVEQHRYTDWRGEKGPDKYALALRALLRHDPDVIFVGEVRDQASCMVTVDAANTGHLVVTTTHANDPVLAYRRMASFLSKERQYDLVNVLSGILAQRLVQLVCKECSTVTDVTQDDLDTLARYAKNKGVSLDGKEFTKKRVANRDPKSGCQHCTGGISGMSGIHGLLIMTPQVRNLLLSRDESDWLKAQEVGSKVTLFDSAYAEFVKGTIELESMLI